jgi:hypothetical protein
MPFVGPSAHLTSFHESSSVAPSESHLSVTRLSVIRRLHNLPLRLFHTGSRPSLWLHPLPPHFLVATALTLATQPSNNRSHNRATSDKDRPLQQPRNPPSSFATPLIVGKQRFFASAHRHDRYGKTVRHHDLPSTGERAKHYNKLAGR